MLMITEGGKYLDLAEIGMPYKIIWSLSQAFQRLTPRLAKFFSIRTLFLVYPWARQARYQKLLVLLWMEAKLSILCEYSLQAEWPFLLPLLMHLGT